MMHINIQLGILGSIERLIALKVHRHLLSEVVGLFSYRLLAGQDSFHVRGFSRKMESHIFLLFHSAVGVLGMVAQAKFSGE